VRCALAGLALAAAVSAAACGGDQGPVAGELSVRLTTPRATDRAIAFFVVGPQHGAAEAAGSSYRLFSASSAAGDTTWMTVVAPRTGGLAAGEVARIAVDDVRRAGSYVVRLSDVAAADYRVGDTAGVSLRIIKP
jgi:hypothetical protein